MRKGISTALACAALWGACAAAQAQTATFEDVSLGFIGNGETLTSGGLIFKQGGEFGGVTDGDSFMFGNAPGGSSGQYYSVFNDTSVMLTRAIGGTFHLTSLRYAYISPIGGVYLPGAEPGALTITAMSSTGSLWTSSYSFGMADTNGEFSFVSLSAGDLGDLATSDLQWVAFSSCTYDGRACKSPFGNQNQFALDAVTAVPEPAALVLALMGLGVVGAAVRRKQAA